LEPRKSKQQIEGQKEVLVNIVCSPVGKGMSGNHEK
jgi:hypothetical protein